MNPVTAPVPRTWTEDLGLRLATLITLLSAALALGFAGLIPPLVCLLTVGLTLIVGLVVPRWIPWLEKDSPHRTAVALAAIGLLIAATAGSGPRAMFSGELSGPLGAAVAELALPDGIPIGLLAALAAGALVAVALELADRRGVQSALVLGIAVLGLASVAAPGSHLLPALIPGWPAALFTLTRLTAGATSGPHSAPETGQSHHLGRGWRQGTRPPMMRRVATTGAASARVVARWQLLPALVVIPASLTVMALVLASGVAKMDKHTLDFGAQNDTGTNGAGRASGYLGGAMDLTTRGSLPADPVIKVPADSPRLWRAGTLDQYTGLSWLATTPARGLPKFVLGSDGTARVSDPPLPADPANSRTDRMEPLEPGFVQVLSPGRLLGLSAPTLLADGEGLISPGDRLVLLGRRLFSSPFEVRSETLPGTSDLNLETMLSAAKDSKASAGTPPALDEALDPRWTALPTYVSDRVRQLGITLVTGAPSRLAAVRAIEAELASRMTYTLDSPKPPEDAVDAVDDVLFISHSGFCEQFASAEVVLLRAAGVPARMAVGFSGGEPDGKGLRVLRRSDAHAWVEVWFPEVGWVTSDPTPAAAETKSRWQSIKSAVRSLVDEPAVRIGALILLILMSVAGVRLLLALRRRFQLDTPDDPTTRALDADLAAAFARLESDLRAEGRPRAANETVAALSRRLAQQRQSDQWQSDHWQSGQPGQSPDPALDRALRVLERALYAQQPPSRQECLSAATAMDQREGGPAVRPSRPK
ncbi:MAG TPA: transglutaminase domain-containing protein [Kineosporiaceae bacterium]|nr:transglutaminase domain-containing protein [Kineosporiaceae bacterium]